MVGAGCCPGVCTATHFTPPAPQQGQPWDGGEVGKAHPTHNQPHISIPIMFKTLLGAVIWSCLCSHTQSLPKNKTSQDQPGDEEGKGMILPSIRKNKMILG